MSVQGLGCVETHALLTRIEYLGRIASSYFASPAFLLPARFSAKKERSVGHFRVGADTDMTIESKRKPRQEDRDRDERDRIRREEVEHERMRQEEALDEALKT